MSRLARRPSSPVGQAVTPIIAGIGFFAVLGGLLWLIASLVSGGKADLNVGKDVFDSLRYERLAKDIDENGPRLYPSLIGTDQSYLYVQHLGDDPLKGWRAFDATREGQPVKCTVVWKPVEKVFEDPCDGATYPADGTGLRQYDAIPNTATKRLVVDLKNPLPSAESTPSTTVAASTSAP
jgi:hypothetical protein